MRAAVLILMITALTGCASIFTDPIYPVQVTSEPSRAKFEIKNEDGDVVYRGTTPDTVKLKSSAGYFDGELYTITFSADGYKDSVYTLNSGVEGWYWGNLLIGGALGMLIIDPATGSMFDLPTKASTTMVQDPSFYAAQEQALTQQQRTGLTQQQQIQKLQQQGLPYDQYQKEFRRIIGQ